MSTPYRSNDPSRPGAVRSWWSVRAASLWFLALSAWLLVGSCGLREPFPTLFCERTRATTRCWYSDDAAYFPSIRSLDGVSISVAPIAHPRTTDSRDVMVDGASINSRRASCSAMRSTVDLRTEGLYFIEEHAATLVTGRSPRGLIVAPTLASNGGCVTDTHDAAEAFFAKAAGPRLALRLNDNELGSIAMPLVGFVPLMLTLLGLILVVTDLLFRAHRVVVDTRTRSISLAFLWEEPLTIQLAPGEVLAIRGDGLEHRVVVSSASGATTAIHTDPRLSPLERSALVKHVNVALKGEQPIAKGVTVSTIVALLLVGAALTVIYGTFATRYDWVHHAPPEFNA